MFTTQRCHQQHLTKCSRGELIQEKFKQITPGYSKLISENRKTDRSNGSCWCRVKCKGTTMLMDGPQISTRRPAQIDDRQRNAIAKDLQLTSPVDHEIGAVKNFWSMKLLFFLKFPKYHVVVIPFVRCNVFGHTRLGENILLIYPS